MFGRRAPRPTAVEIGKSYNKDIKNKWAVITGSTSGLGLETARALYLNGANIIICARSRQNGDQAAREIKESGSGMNASTLGVILVEELDLADLRSVKIFSEAIKSRVPSIDLLICNAGVMATPLGTTTDGFETQIGTNHVGHQALVQELLPFMRDHEASSGGTPGRVVVLTSISHKWGTVELKDLNFQHGRRYNPWAAYAQSKLACLLLVKELARRLQEQGSAIKVAAVHPGVIFTGLVRHRNPTCMTPIVKALLSPLTKTPTEGAATTVYAAAAEIPSGSYLENCGIATPAPKAEDPELAQKLFDETERMIADALKVTPGSMKGRSDSNAFVVSARAGPERAAPKPVTVE